MVNISHLVVTFFPAMYFGLAPEAHYPQLEIFLASSPFNIFYSGNTAVCIFFVLSGYVLTYKFFLTEDIKIILSGMIKRYVRLFIPVFAAMLILYIFVRLGLFFNDVLASYTKSEILFVVFIEGKPGLREIIKQSFFNAFFAGRTVYDHVLWTMRYELAGSYLIFIFILIFRLKKIRFLAYGLLAILLWDSYYLGFIIGMFLADITAKETYRKKLQLNFFAKLLLSIVAIITASYPMGVKTPVGLYSLMTFSTQPLSAQIYHNISATIILFLALTDSKFQRILESAIPKFLGKISFSLYLVHWFVIFSISSYLFLILRNYISYPLNVAFVCIVSFPLMIAFSLVFCKYIDGPSMKAANFFSAYVMGKLSRIKKLQSFFPER